MLASACSGAVLLGEAGLLTNCEATIHWGYAAMLANNYPGVKVKPN
jgi:transcriptional regulator GlxA family with amidase domain